MKKLRYFFETQLVRFAAWLFPRLPRHVTLMLARLFGDIACAVDARGRNTALENLRVVFGAHYTEADRRNITRACYQNFARNFFDLFWSTSLTPANHARHLHFHFDDPSDEASALETGGVWVTIHYGNFEFTSLIHGYRGHRFTVVAQDFKNPALTAIFSRIRAGSGHQVIPSQNAMLKLARVLQQRGHSGMLTDLTIKPGRAAAAIRCFGLQTCVTTLHVMLAQRFGLAIMPVICTPLEDGTYDLRVAKAIRPDPKESPARVAQQVWDVFEPEIRQHPEMWMWMYKHWRYLPGTERDPAYPDYANPNKDFRALVKGA